MKRLFIIFLILSVAAYAVDCKPGYKFNARSGVGCQQENCNDIPDAHYSYTGYCICGSSGSMYENPDDPNKECALPHDDPSCPGCVYACVHLDEPCPGSVDKTPQTGSTDIPVTGELEPEVEIMDIDKMEEELMPKWDDVKKKLEKDRSTITYLEFLVYLKELEKANPNMTWKELISYLHIKAYPEDIDRTTYFDIKLFQHGKESDGYKNVKDVTPFIPKFVMNPDNKKVDIAHSYAGLRSDLNRGSVPGWFLRRMNTHWGDTYQVYGPTIITLLADREWKTPEWFRAPKDQRRGNDIGLWLSDYYRTDGNEDKKLSEAYSDYFYK